jgi:hypothetical protein
MSIRKFSSGAFPNRITKLFFILLLTGVHVNFSYGQECSWFPADCPSDRQMPDSADRFGNPVTPAEVSMELRLHEFFTGLMQKEAEKKGWESYQYDETGGSGYLNADRSGPLAINLRPPHDYEISFIFIINRDSLRAWQDWQKDFLSNMQTEINKMTSNNDYSKFANLKAFKKNREESFRNASMIRVKIEVNSSDAIASSVTEDLHQTGQLKIAHAKIAFEAHNDKTDEQAIFELNQFKRCPDLALILFGNWNLTPDGYQYYRPTYRADGKKTDLITPKTIPSDAVRVIAMHVEGAPLYINQFLQSLDTDMLFRIIAE